ncbi:unnamed protein product, partial [Chrysoparadoxa australica]
APLPLPEALKEAGGRDGPLSVANTMRTLATHPQFLGEFWQRKPVHIAEELPNLSGTFGMSEVEHAVESDFLEAGRGTFAEGRSGWKMAAVSQPRGKSFEEAKLRFKDVEKAMKEKSGTVVINSAGAFIPPLAGVCLECCDAFSMPSAINLYLTAPGQVTSAPPHTDKQDVFVLQTSGRKRWRVFAPPPPNAKPKADPMARGKGTDVLTLEEMDAPLIDTVLSPGNILYMPAGFPHTTDTVTGMEDSKDDSVHLTVGVDSHVWSLNYAELLRYCYVRSQMKPPEEILLPPSNYWKLQETLPLGFLGEGLMEGFTRWSDMKGALQQAMTEGLADRARLADPEAWKDKTDQEIAQALKAEEVTDRLIAHHSKMLGAVKEMYADVCYALSEAPNNLSYFRSLKYFKLMEKTMEDLVAWGNEGSAEGAVQAAGAGGGAVGMESKGGFGMGAGGKKGGKAKKKKKK